MISSFGKTMLGLVLMVSLSFLPWECCAGTNENGRAFLEENRKKDNVVSLPSGLQYKVLKKGKGNRHPTVDSPCSCHYEGKLIDGSVFDSSYERGDPTTFAPNQVIRGWTEAYVMTCETLVVNLMCYVFLRF